MAVPEALNQAREKALKTQGARQTGSYQPSEQAVSAKVSTARLAKTTQQSNESLRRDAGPFGLCHCEVSVQEGTIWLGSQLLSLGTQGPSVTDNKETQKKNIKAQHSWPGHGAQG